MQKGPEPGKRVQADEIRRAKRARRVDRQRELTNTGPGTRSRLRERIGDLLTTAIVWPIRYDAAPWTRE